MNYRKNPKRVAKSMLESIGRDEAIRRVQTLLDTVPANNLPYWREVLVALQGKKR